MAREREEWGRWGAERARENRECQTCLFVLWHAQRTAMKRPFHILSSIVKNVPSSNGRTPMNRHQFRCMPSFLDCDVSATSISVVWIQEDSNTSNVSRQNKPITRKPSLSQNWPTRDQKQSLRIDTHETTRSSEGALMWVYD